MPAYQVIGDDELSPSDPETKPGPKAKSRTVKDGSRKVKGEGASKAKAKAKGKAAGKAKAKVKASAKNTPSKKRPAAAVERPADEEVEQPEVDGDDKEKEKERNGRRWKQSRFKSFRVAIDSLAGWAVQVLHEHGMFLLSRWTRLRLRSVQLLILPKLLRLPLLRSPNLSST